MAEEVGLFARFKFLAKSALASMAKTERAFTGLNRQAEQMKKGLQGVSAGMTDLTVVGAAAGAGAGLVVKKFADFGGQMGAVKAVLGQEAAPEFGKLEALAKQLGATTAFTAVQAAEAMENLARAGQRPVQVMASLPAVLDAAAAEGMDLGTAADIVASNLAAFGLKADQATRVADTLAFVSAKTNTNMVSLQEGMKFAAPVARDLGVSLEDTAGTLGALADIGLKGTLSGTAFKNALLNITKASKKGFVQVGKYNVQVEKTADGSIKALDTFQNIIAALGNIDDKGEQAAASIKVLGLRGLGVKTAVQALTKEKIETLFGRIEVGADGVAQRIGGIADKSRGASKRMAEMRLDNLKGQFTKLSSAVDGVTIEMGAAISNSVGLGGGIKTITGQLGQAAKAFQFFSKAGNLDEQQRSIDGVSNSVMEFVRGFMLGLRDVGKTIRGVFGTFGAFTGGSSAGTTRLITKMVGLAAVIAPVGLAIKGVTKLFGGFAKTAVGAARLAAGALGGIAKVGGGLLQKIPGLGKVLPGTAGKLAKAAGGLEKITAQPVRVVNFDEMGGGLSGAGRLRQQRRLKRQGRRTRKDGLGTEAQAVSAVVGGLAGVRAGLKDFIGQFGKTGAFLNSSFSTMGKSGMGLAARLGVFGGAITVVGGAGYAFGSWLDKRFGISDKLADGLWNLFNKTEMIQSKARVKAHEQKINVATVNKMAGQLVDFSRRGVKVQTAPGGEKVAVTRQLAEERIRKFLTSKAIGKSQLEANKIIAGLASQLQGIRDQPVKVEVKVDGKKIAEATAMKKQENSERRGLRQQPGARRRAAQGG